MLFDAATCTYAHFVWSLVRQPALLFRFTARTVARPWAASLSLIDRFGRTSSSHAWRFHVVTVQFAASVDVMSSKALE
jgi:hypothetical protein